MILLNIIKSYRQSFIYISYNACISEDKEWSKPPSSLQPEPSTSVAALMSLLLKADPLVGELRLVLAA